MSQLTDYPSLWLQHFAQQMPARASHKVSQNRRWRRWIHVMSQLCHSYGCDVSHVSHVSNVSKPGQIISSILRRTVSEHISEHIMMQRNAKKCKETISILTQTIFNILQHVSTTWLQDISRMFSCGLTRTGSRFQWYFSNCLTSRWKPLEFGRNFAKSEGNLWSPEAWVFLAHVCT